MVLDKIGSAIFNAQWMWDSYAYQNKIKNPFSMIDEIKNEYTHYEELYDAHGSYKGTKVIKDDPTPDQQKRLQEAEEYRDKYIVDREIWVGKYLLEKNGYDVLSYFAQMHNPESIFDKEFLQWFNTIHPCEGAQGQCNIFCSKFSECNFKENK